jgi:hypothetical protein
MTSFTNPKLTVLNEKHWTGIALELPKPIGAVKAFEILDDLNLSDSGKKLLVVGKNDELKRIVKNRKADPFCAIRLDFLCYRNFSQFIEILTAIADAYCDADRMDAAYWMFQEVIGMYVELYFHPVIYDQLELLSLGAGNKITPGLKVPRTAEDDFRLMRTNLEPHRVKYPKWWESTFLCFYEHGPHEYSKIPQIWNVVVNNVILSDDGILDISQAESHQVVCPLQAVVQDEPDDFEKAKLYMVLLMMMSEAERILGKLPDYVQSASRFCGAELALKWDGMNSKNKRELEMIYSNMTSGLDFRSEFRV